MMSHTPGPWRVGGRSGNTGEAEEIVAGLRVIAWTADTYNDEEDDGEVTDEDRANARLIAAAPELLAACRQSVNALNIAPRFRVGDTDSYAIASTLGRVISKAEGRSE